MNIHAMLFSRFFSTFFEIAEIVSNHSIDHRKHEYFLSAVRQKVSDFHSIWDMNLIIVRVYFQNYLEFSSKIQNIFFRLKAMEHDFPKFDN